VKYDVILLDADGTLFDYDKAQAYALEKTYKHFRIPYNTAELKRFRLINDRIWLDYEQGKIDSKSLRTVRFEQLFAGRNLQVSSEDFSTVYLKHLGDAAFLIEGAEEACRYLSAKYRVAIITNGLTEVQLKRIGRSPLRDYIYEIVTSEEAGCSKPGAGIFDYAFRKIACSDKGKTLIVGDSLSSDIQGGHNYGIDTCWYNPQGRVNGSGLKPRYEIRHLRELQVIL
jgi:2-haloacid dehalogenase